MFSVVYSSVSTLEKQLEIYRTAEERKSHLLSSYRIKQERLESEIRSLREVTTRHNSNATSPLLVRVTAMQALRVLMLRFS